MRNSQHVYIGETRFNGRTLGKGRVESVAFAGMSDRARIRLDHPVSLELEALISPEDSRQTPLEAGQEVYIALQDFHLLGAQTAPA